MINDVQAMLSRAAGHRVRIKEADLEAIVGLALMDEDYAAGTPSGEAATMWVLRAFARERERALLELYKVDALMLERWRQTGEAIGLHIGLRRLLMRVTDGLNQTRKMMLRVLRSEERKHG